MKLKFCILVPVYNHENGLEKIRQSLLNTGLPIILIDDGSQDICRDYLTAFEKHDSVYLERHLGNKGKGAAIKTGLAFAQKLGFSHAIQVDADGQHDLDQMPEFIELAKQNPSTLISGKPIYDESAPIGRVVARYLTHVWVWINTLSFQIKDSMCGYRVYPVDACVALLGRFSLGNRMEFDTEIMVHWAWQGKKVLQLGTKVRYPLDGVSHFQAFRDNVLISKMHATMFGTMLLTWPAILWRRLRGAD